jgi:hypothetical protein
MHVAEVSVEFFILSFAAIFARPFVPIMATKEFPPKIIDAVVPAHP